MRTVDDLVESGLQLIKLFPKTKKYMKRAGEPIPYYDAESDESTPIRDFNLAVQCGQALDGGGYLGVLDVDDNIEFEQFLKDNGPLPETFEIKTPGKNGRHFYFKTSEPIKHKGSVPGYEKIEFFGHHYVVGPFSEYGEGYYEPISDFEIADAPEFLTSRLKNGVPKKVYFDAGEHLVKKGVVKGGHDNELFKEACELKDQGYADVHELAAMIEVCFNSRYKEFQDESRPYTERDFLRIAESAIKRPQSIVKEEEVLAETSKKPSTTIKKSKDPLEECFELAEGIVGDIAKQAYSSAKRSYHGFALASGLQVVSGVAQGGYMGPDTYDPMHPDFSLSLYQWLTAQAATGKDAYHRIVHSYLYNTDKRLVCPSFASNKALRASMFAFNSSVSVIDELGDIMKRLSSPRASSYQTAILTDLKMLTNNLPILEFDMTGSKKPPAIFGPKYGLFGTGTRDSFLSLLNSEMVGSGLLSRFMVIPEPFLTRKSVRPPFRIDKRIVNQLTDINHVGLTRDSEEKKYDDILNEFFAYMDKGGQRPESLTATEAKTILKFEPSAKLTLVDFERAQETIFMNFHKKNMGGVNPGSIADRAPFHAKKIAAVHCVGRGSETINDKDLEFAIKLSKVLADYAMEAVQGNAGESQLDKTMSRALGVIKDSGEPLNITAITRKQRFSDTTTLKRALESLWYAGEIQVIYQNQAIDLEQSSQIPRGALYKVK